MSNDNRLTFVEVRLWFGGYPATGEADETSGVLVAAKDGGVVPLDEVVAYVTQNIVRHYDGECGCQKEAGPAGL